MKKDQTISIPFPAWDGIFKVAAICGELKHNKMFASVPDFRTPRGINVARKGAGEGFDDRVVVEYWAPMGHYATATLGGTADDSYGTAWTLIGLKLRWQWNGYLRGEENLVRLKLDSEQVKAINLTAYLRAEHLQYCEQVGGDMEEAKRYLAAAEAKSDAIIAELAAPTRAAYERRQTRLAIIRVTPPLVG